MNNQTITAAPWEWRKVGDDWVLWGAHHDRPIVLDVGRIGVNPKRLLRVRVDGLMRAFYPEHPDARLIRAAPDLLEACKVLDRIVSKWELNSDGCWPLAEAVQEEMPKFRAAIASATTNPENV